MHNNVLWDVGRSAALLVEVVDVRDNGKGFVILLNNLLSTILRYSDTSQIHVELQIPVTTIYIMYKLAVCNY